MSHEKMSADELAAICERDAAVGALIARGALIPGPVVMAALDDRGRLLRHIDAIETKRPARPVASFDRDALGRELSSMLGKTPVQWEELSEGYRSRAMAAAVALHVLGAASRQGEIDALRARVADMEAWSAKDVEEERENARREHVAEIERLTRAHEAQLLDAIQDRDDARQEAEEAEQEKRVMAEHLIAARAKVERLTAELAAERAKADRRWTDQDTAMRNAARAEGAREEREAIDERITALLAEHQSDRSDHVGGIYLALDAIRARGQAK